MTPEEAQQILEDEVKARTAACSAEMRELLERHGCSLDVAVTFRSDKPPEFSVKIINNRQRGL